MSTTSLKWQAGLEVNMLNDTKTNLVLLAPHVAQAFPNDEAVNEALRLLIKVAQRQQPNTML